MKGYLELHKEALVVDTHCDTIARIHPGGLEQGLGVRADVGHVDIPRLIEGGVDCQVFAVSGFDTLERALHLIDVFYGECEKNSGKLSPVYFHEDVLRVHGEGKVSGLLAVEGGEIIGRDVSVLRVLHRLGVRMFSLVYYRSELADGAFNRAGEIDRAKGGLTSLGVQVAEEAQRLGIVLDVSHLNDTGLSELLEIVKKPVIASHSSCRALCSSYIPKRTAAITRNMTDEQIKALADRGGVIGVNFASVFLHPSGKATVETLVDHIDRIVDLAGVDHVGLGSDYDGIPEAPQGLEDVSRLPNITRVLVDRGYSDDDVKKILGENHLRVFKQVMG